MEMTAVSCHRRRTWHVGRNHAVSHFKRRNGPLRVAIAVAARLQHLYTRMNGSGAERAEKGKKKERKKILNVKMVCFFPTQVTGNYSLPITFSKKVPPPSIDRFTIPTIDLLSSRKKERRKRKEKGKGKEKNHQITTAQPSQRPHPPLLPRQERRLDQQHCDNHLHVASPLHRSHPPASLLRLVRHVCRFEQLWRFPLQRRLGGRRGGLECYLGGDCMLVEGFWLVGWLVVGKGGLFVRFTYLVLRDSLLQRQLVLVRLLLRGREELKGRPSF